MVNGSAIGTPCMEGNLANIYQIYKCTVSLVLEIPLLAYSIDTITYVGGDIYFRIFTVALFVNRKR